MGNIIITDSPILQSTAQLLVLPTSSDGRIVDPILNRCKTLYPNNYQRYKQACRDGSFPVGSSLLIKHNLEHSGLGVASNAGRPIYLANIAVTDHAYHPTRLLWLSDALDKLYLNLYELIRYKGLRRIAFLARPLLDHRAITNDTPNNISNAKDALYNQMPSFSADLKVPILDWEADIYPLIAEKLESLPKVRIDIHLPTGFLSSNQ